MSLPPVVKTVTVKCTPDKAFRYFTEDFHKWWPGASHSVVAFSSGFKDEPFSCELEGRQGGRILEKARNGEVYDWGTIVEWEPPARLAFTWHPGRPSDSSQLVEITFSPVPEGTTVQLCHTGWEKLGSEAEEAWKGYNSGWETVFTVSFANYVESHTEEL